VKLYFDTAYIARCYLNERDGPKVRSLARSATGLYSSALSKEGTESGCETRSPRTSPTECCRCCRIGGKTAQG
jgi:hypothetical protein